MEGCFPRGLVPMGATIDSYPCRNELAVYSVAVRQAKSPPASSLQPQALSLKPHQAYSLDIGMPSFLSSISTQDLAHLWNGTVHANVFMCDKNDDFESL